MYDWWCCVCGVFLIYIFYFDVYVVDFVIELCDVGAVRVDFAFGRGEERCRACLIVCFYCCEVVDVELLCCGCDVMFFVYDFSLFCVWEWVDEEVEVSLKFKGVEGDVFLMVIRCVVLVVLVVFLVKEFYVYDMVKFCVDW